MICDQETNFLYLADSLYKNKYSDFLCSLESLLRKHSILFNFIPKTEDIWAVDFMPIQIDANKFVQFKYKPDYLHSEKELKTISDVDSICEALKFAPLKSKLVLDGGNIVRTKNKIIMCDKIFKENADMKEKEVIYELKNLFEIDDLFFVPWDKKSDIIGHADGMVRFVDNHTVVINDYSKEKPEFQRAFRMALHNAKLDWIEVPYNPYNNTTKISAEGIYLNYLQMEQLIIVPTFKRKEDDEAVNVLEQIFKGQTVVPIDSNVIAREGGILNCISWNIYEPPAG